MAEIVVVGGGFIGLSFALGAHQRGFDVEVYDKAAAPSLPGALTSQVIAVNPVSMGFLRELGVWDRIPDKFVTHYHRMSVFDGEGTGSVSFSAEEGGLADLGAIVDQGALRVALAEQAGIAGLTVRWQQTADIDSVERDLLVAADGAHSATREALGLKKAGYAYDQNATVCIAEFSREHGHQAYQWFLGQGPVALLPLSEPRKMAVVWSSRDDMSTLDEPEFMKALEASTEDTLGSVISVSPRFSFPLIQQQAWQYVTRGAVLLGDAAHAIHPLAGQGANLGFADARCLITELCAARLEGRGIGDLVILKRYEKKRKTENYLAAAAMEGFHRLFTSGSGIVGLLRSRGLRLVNENKTLKRLAISVASGRV